MTNLTDNLYQIKSQKDEYLLPGNVKKNLTVFGITGSMTKYNPKVYLDNIYKFTLNPDILNSDIFKTSNNMLEIFSRNAAILLNVELKILVQSGENLYTYLCDDTIQDIALALDIDIQVLRNLTQNKWYRIIEQANISLELVTDLIFVQINFTSNSSAEMAILIDGEMQYPETDQYGQYFDISIFYDLFQDVEYLKPKLENEDIEITEAGNKTITFSRDYDGLNTVNITCNLNTIIKGNIWATSSAMTNSFTIASYLTQLPNLNLELNSAAYLFQECSNITNIPHLNIVPNYQLTNMAGMCRRCISLINTYNLSFINLSNVTDMSNLFYGCSNIRTSNISGTSVQGMSYMYHSCSNLKNVTSMGHNAVDTSHMFEYCFNLVNIPYMPITKVTNAAHMFNACYVLNEVNVYNAYNLVNARSMFQSCTNITSIHNLNITKTNDCISMFEGCSNLVSLSDMNFETTKHVHNMFRFCPNLSNDSLTNILNSMIRAYNVPADNRTLSYIGLTEDQANICVNLPRWPVCELAGWTTGY